MIKEDESDVIEFLCEYLKMFLKSNLMRSKIKEILYG